MEGFAVSKTELSLLEQHVAGVFANLDGWTISKDLLAFLPAYVSLRINI